MTTPATSSLQRQRTAERVTSIGLASRVDGALAGTVAWARAARISALLDELIRGRDVSSQWVNPARFVAAVLRAVLSPAELRSRLGALGLDERWRAAALVELSLTGGGVHLRDGAVGRVVTGPGMDGKIAEVFPELMVLAVRNDTVYGAPPGSSNPSVSITYPGTSASGSIYWDLSLVSEDWEILEIEAHIVGHNAGATNSADEQVPVKLTVQDDHGSTTCEEVPYLSSCSLYSDWFSELDWLLENAGDANVSRGSKSMTVEWGEGTDEGTCWVNSIELLITYTGEGGNPNAQDDPGILNIGRTPPGTCSALGKQAGQPPMPGG